MSLDGVPDGRKRPKMSNNEIVNEYETYRKRLKQDGHLAYKGEGTSALIKNLEELQQIYTIVQKNSSLSVHFSDAQALNDTSNFAAINAKNLKMDDLGLSLTCDDFVTNIKAYLMNNLNSTLGEDDDDEKAMKLKQAKMEPDSQSELPDESAMDLENEEEEEDGFDNSYYEQKFNSFSWLKLGLLMYKTSNKAIPMEFLNGPLETEKKAVLRNRTVDDTKGLTLSTAQQVEVEDMEMDTQNTSNLVRSVFSTVRSKQAQNPEPVNFFKFFIDPESFSQSVENLFFTSFLIRDARLELSLDDKGVPMIKRVDNERTRQILHDDRASKAAATHHIASFDYETWKALINTFNITESYLGHRTVEADAFDMSETEQAESE